MRWIGLSVALFGLFAGIVLGAPVKTFIDLPAAVFVVFVAGGVILTAHGWTGIGTGWRALFGKVDRPDATLAKAVAETGIQAFVAAGWIGVIVGVIQMLSQLDDPSKIGPGAATALLTALYGYVLAYLVCMPLGRSFGEMDGPLKG